MIEECHGTKAEEVGRVGPIIVWATNLICLWCCTYVQRGSSLTKGVQCMGVRVYDLR